MIYYAMLIHNLISTHEECTKKEKSTSQTNNITTTSLKKLHKMKRSKGKHTRLIKKQNELNEQQNEKTSDSKQL